MPITDVCAVVVTYHPDADVIENLKLLSQQVPCVVVVDNGSPAEAIDPLRETSTNLGFELIENGENLGIAAALNQGLRRLQGRTFAFVLLFDQDSRITPAYVEAMWKRFTALQTSCRIAILVPRYVDRRFGIVLAPPLGRSGSLEAATTSGSMMPMGLFPVTGYFAEGLFIDGVDYEYSLRVRRAGFTIEECAEAVLLHSPGAPTYHRIFGGRPFQAANYSPIRRYYQERNKIWVARRYWGAFSSFCLRQFLTSFKDLLKIILVEQDKWAKGRYFFLGVFDGLRGRTGRRGT